MANGSRVLEILASGIPISLLIDLATVDALDSAEIARTEDGPRHTA